MGQLTFSSALSGIKRWGRERRSCLMYADDADRADEGRLGTALRLKASRHEKCEQLSSGGFMTRPYSELQEDLKEMKGYVDAWPYTAQLQIIKADTERGVLNPRSGNS